MSKSRRRESIVRLQKSRYGHRIGALWQHDVSTLYGFFSAAARRSKRGYRGKLHRCNDAGEAARVLSRDLSAMNDNGAITGMDAREDGVYITYSTGADTVTKKLCDPDIKKHKITGKTFSVKASEISASKILGVGIEKFSYSVGVDNANWSYGCSISSSYSDDSASGSVSATWGGPAGAGNYNISATWIVYYLG